MIKKKQIKWTLPLFNSKANSVEKGCQNDLLCTIRNSAWFQSPQTIQLFDKNFLSFVFHFFWQKHQGYFKRWQQDVIEIDGLPTSNQSIQKNQKSKEVKLDVGVKISRLKNLCLQITISQFYKLVLENQLQGKTHLQYNYF